MNDTPVLPKVLVVDDEPINIKILNDALEDRCEVLFATSGLRALDLAVAQQPDLILLDIRMPEMDGYAVCRALKADALLRDIPVIFITALNGEVDEAVGLQAGAADYIAKPFNQDIVRLRVMNHLELKRQRDLLSRLALIDSLTELPNRRVFDERLLMEWRRALRAPAPLSLIMIDIDHFKGYNDTYGHLAGDGCLRLVAQTMAESANRAGDLLARYGGEEFVCLLPGTDIAGALSVAELLRAKVEDLAIDHKASPVRPVVSISLGVASAYPNRDSPPETLVEAADQRLYRAKGGGRNRVASGAGRSV